MNFLTGITNLTNWMGNVIMPTLAALFFALGVLRYPVTNAEFKKFIDAAKYRPMDDHSFLKDWKNGTYPTGWENEPATWVSLEDARAYAAWAGKRLPHEWEWQYRRAGNGWADLSVGEQLGSVGGAGSGQRTRPASAGQRVTRIPNGSSPFGVMDLSVTSGSGPTSISTSTPGRILRGGSYYQPQGSMWYFPQAYRLTEHGKLLLMAPSKDRAGTLGFRCVVDAQ